MKSQSYLLARMKHGDTISSIPEFNNNVKSFHEKCAEIIDCLITGKCIKVNK